MKKVRIALALLLIFTMVAPAALAEPVQTSEKSSIVGVGTYANPATYETWEIAFPTAEALSFTVDPMQRLKARYSGDDAEYSVDANAKLLFPGFDEDGNQDSYKAESAPIVVENHGSTDVTVELNIRPTDSNLEIRGAANKYADTDTKPGIYFQAKQTTGANNETWTNEVGAVGTNLSANIAKLAVTGRNAWVLSYDSDKDIYVNTLDSEIDTNDVTWPSAKFMITGGVNPKCTDEASWNDPSLVAPNLQLTWTVRNQSCEVIPVVFADGVQTGTKYTMEADCIKALPGQTVNVYVKPNYPDAESADGYTIDLTASGSGPKTIKTATYNDFTKTYTNDTTGDQLVYFGNGVESDNGTFCYSFVVPTKGGTAGFTLKTAADATTNDNKITISAGPTIKKVTTTSTLTSTSTTSP